MNDETPQRSRVGWWLLGAFLLVGVLLTLLVSGWTIGAGRRAQAELARLRAAGEPADPADLEEFYVSPAADDDTTRLWLAACLPLESKDFQAAAGALPLVGTSEGKIPPLNQPWTELEAAEALLKKFEPSLGKLHEAADRGGAARYPTDFRMGFAMLVEHAQRLRGGARLLALEAQVRARRGDAAGAARALHAGFMLAGSLKNEPVVVSQLVRIACDGLARQQLQELLPDVPFSDADLAQLQADLRAADYREAWRRSLMGERVIGIQAFDDPASAGMPGAQAALWRMTRQDDLVCYLRLMRTAIDSSKESWPEARAGIEKAEAELKTKIVASPLARARYAMTALIVPALTNSSSAGMRGTAQNRAAEAALAIERYRQRHGKLPDNLQRLVPDFFPTTSAETDNGPTDPYDYKPLRFKLGDGEYVVYSIGADGKDDGGQGDDRGEPDVAFKVRLHKQD